MSDKPIEYDVCPNCGEEDDLYYLDCCGKKMCSGCKQEHDKKYHMNTMVKKNDLETLIKEVLNTVNEVAPEGWEGTVKAMKKHKDIDNPWALSHWMKNKGMKSHKKEAIGSESQLTPLDDIVRDVIKSNPKFRKTPKAALPIIAALFKKQVGKEPDKDMVKQALMRAFQTYFEEAEKKQPIGVSPDKLKHTECPKCKNRVTVLKSTDPVVWGCEKCGHNWGWDQVNEEHGDVHYWGKQPTDKQHKISTGYDGTVPLKENMTDKKALRKLVIEAAKEVINEYQHEQQHEQQEIAQFKMIKDRVDQLILLHQRGAYDEAKELELIRQIKKLAIEIEADHTGTKITANEKVQ